VKITQRFPPMVRTVNPAVFFVRNLKGRFPYISHATGESACFCRRQILFGDVIGDDIADTEVRPCTGKSPIDLPKNNAGASGLHDENPSMNGPRLTESSQSTNSEYYLQSEPGPGGLLLRGLY
jgi:hypothetical protein